MRNTVTLGGRITERQPLRYTPAGIPVVQMRLAHGSRQQEAGIGRDVEMDVAATAAGPVARRIDPLALGTLIQATGFLARKGRNVRALVFHITEFEIIED